MNDIDGKTAIDMGEIDYIDNSRRLKRLQHDYNSKYDQKIFDHIVNWRALKIIMRHELFYHMVLFFIYGIRNTI